MRTMPAVMPSRSVAHAVVLAMLWCSASAHGQAPSEAEAPPTDAKPPGEVAPTAPDGEPPAPRSPGQAPKKPKADREAPAEQAPAEQAPPQAPPNGAAQQAPVDAAAPQAPVDAAAGGAAAVAPPAAASATAPAPGDASAGDASAPATTPAVAQPAAPGSPGTAAPGTAAQAPSTAAAPTTEAAAITTDTSAGDADAVEVISVDAGDAPTTPWNAGLSWSQGYNVAGIDRGGEQSFNPEYAWGFSLDLGWTFDKLDLSVGVSQGLSIELTDSDSTVSRQEPLWSDTSLSARRPFELELDPLSTLTLTPSLGIGLPLSKASQAASLVMSTTGTLGASYAYEPFLEGLSASTSFSYARRWATSNTVKADKPYPCDPAGADPVQDCVHLGGSTTTRDVLVLALGAGVTLVPDLSVGLDVSFGWNRGHGLDTTSFDSLTEATFVYEDDRGTHWRNSRTLRLSLDYSWTEWLSTTVFARNAMADLGSNGQRRAPLEPLDTVIGLSIAFSADQAYLAAGPAPEEGEAQ